MKPHLQKIKENLGDNAKTAYHKASLSMKGRYHRHYHPEVPYGLAHFWVDALSIFVIGLLVLLIGFIFFIYKDYNEDFLKFEMEMYPQPLEAISFSSMIISYENISDYYFKNTSLYIDADSGFEFIRAVPLEYDSTEKKLFIGDIEPGGKGTVMLKYRIVSGFGERLGIQARFNYSATKTQNEDIYLFKNKDYIIAGSFDIKESSIGVSADLPEVFVKDSEYSFDVNLSSLVDEPLNDKIETCIILPDNLKFVSSFPVLDDAYCRKIEKIDPLTIIKTRLHLKAEKTGSGVIEILSYLLQTKDSQLIHIYKEDIDVMEPGLDTYYLVNQKNNNVLDFGKKYNLSLGFDNTKIDWEECLSFDCPKIVMPIPLDVINKESIVVENGKLDGDKIIWEMANEYFSQDSMLFSFQASLISKEDYRNNNTDNLGYVINTFSLSPYISYIDKEIILESNLLKINSDFDVQASSYYYTKDNEQIGRGPLPARSGEGTSFWVFYKMTNTVNALDNLKIEAKLPANVFWTGETTSSSIGKFYYDLQTRKVVLNIGGFGYSNEPSEAGFELKIYPTKFQAGQKAELLNNINGSAKDTNTGEMLEIELDSLLVDVAP